MKTRISIILILLNCMVFTSGKAQLADQFMAEKAALGWISMHPQFTLEHSRILTDIDDGILGYQYNLSPQGYVVLTANQGLPPVIAYSLNASFNGIDCPVNPLEDILVRDIKQRLGYLRETQEAITSDYRQQWNLLIEHSSGHRIFEQWPPPGSTSTGGWLETNWKQSAPYNKFCPMDEINNARSLAGCPAVALAMIIHYQKTLNGTRFSGDDDYYHSYAGRQYWIDDNAHELDFASFPVLNEYYDSIAAKFPGYTALNENEIASLVFGCGVAARQVYTSEVSGTFGVSQAYDAYLRFGYQDASLIYDSDTSFYTQMKNNMIDGIPVHLAVLSNTGQGGHNVVADGYNTDNYYHLNFGWGGSYNGWYLLPEEIPYNLTIIEGAVMDIGVTHVNVGKINTRDNYVVGIYPNPSDGHINIHIELTESVFVQVEARDASGKLLNTICAGIMDNGAHEFQWQADVSAGIYYIILNDGSNRISKKALIIN